MVSYTIIRDLSRVDTFATGINKNGEIVGYEDSSGPANGFLYDSGTFTPLNDPAAFSITDAYGINDSGQVVGWFVDKSANTHGFSYINGSYTTLDDPNAKNGVIHGGTQAYGVNDSGQIVGTYFGLDNLSHGFFYNAGQYTDLNDPKAVNGTYAFGINNAGQVVGYYSDINSENHGFVYSSGTFTDIQDPLSSLSFGGTVVSGINNNGDMVGWYYDNGAAIHGFYYSGGTYTTIDGPAGVGASAIGLNDNGQIVGNYPVSGGNAFASFVTQVTSTPPNQYNGHTYAFMPFNGTPQSWSQAHDAAAAMGGYLATITSQGENDFILNNVLAGHLPQGGPAVFIGASDAAHEGVWQWVTGPDAGTTFWNGAVNGSAVSGQYANWQPGNPNNATNNADGSENYAVMAGDGTWVDVPSVRSAGATVGYVVEFNATATFPFTGDAMSQIEAIYIGYFGRAGDPDGTNFWTNQLLNGGSTVQTMTGIAASYSVQPESQAQYPFLANPLGATTSGAGNQLDQFINSVYQNLFGRAADGTDTSGGLGYWRGQILNVLATHDPTALANELGSFILQVTYGAQGQDQTVLANKVSVADAITQTFLAHNIHFGNDGSPADQFAHTDIASVTADAASVTAAEVAIIGIIHSLV